jgi:hypothetical protein
MLLSTNFKHHKYTDKALCRRKYEHLPSLQKRFSNIQPYIHLLALSQHLIYKQKGFCSRRQHPERERFLFRNLTG